MAVKRAPTVLNESHYDALMDAKQRLEELTLIMPKAKQCGVDCEEYQKMAGMAADTIDTWLKVWFSKGRPK